MTRHRFLGTSTDLANAIRETRTEQGLTQQTLAGQASVSRKFISDLESGHPRAELEKVLQVLDALGIHAVALPSVRSHVDPSKVNLDEVLANYGRD